MTIEERKKAMQEAKAKITKDFGAGTVMNLADAPDMNIEAISTGSLGLDICLGIGGLPRGRIVEIYGPESSGKTTIAIHTIAEAQKNPESMCAIVDAEHSFDRKYASNLGVDLKRLDICQPNCGEEGLEVADRLISSGAYDVVVIDSVAALVPKAELEGEMGENKMGLHARLMSQALRKLTGSVKKTNTVCIFINQLREKIGVMFGSPEVTTGGNALKFYASVRLDVRRSLTSENTIKQDDITMGNLTRVKVIKNKCAPPFRNCEFNIMYGKGIDKVSEVIDAAKAFDLLTKRKEKNGPIMITYQDMKVPLEEFEQMLEEDGFYQAIYQQINNRLNGITEKHVPDPEGVSEG